ncbi:hypothetical protein OF83DRAFT_1165444 [Amylostereum chailletii]|nr:hypothetical protein OF83DRAFT_1165444 [Amylostereum chailletii]
MATASAPNTRASLLSGLRTGGVRSTSINVPHTAAPGATFNVPRFASSSYNHHEEEDELADMVAQKMYVNAPPRMQMQYPPMTAAVDGSNNRFSQQQAVRGQMMNAMNQRQAQAQQQALQMQMMQLEMMRLQALQAQQFQAELLAQAQHQQQQSRGYHPPATAGPLNTSFGVAQTRRPSQADQLRSQLGLSYEEQVPMTAALGGKFGSRGPYGGAEDEFPGSRNGNGNGNSYPSPMSPGGYTNVISGGASLSNGGASVAPSKSDSAVSWRRASTNHSVLRRSPPPEVKITTAPDVRITPPPLDTDASTPTLSAPNGRGSPGASPARARPSPLRFTPSAPLPSVAVDEGTDGEDNESESSSKSATSSSPATPSSASFAPPLSPREEASKKLYEGLGLGRPAPVPAPMSPSPATVTASLPLRVLSQPVRQPRGPPSGADELGPRNFATRIRKQAIGGLGALMGARERRDVVVEAY